MAVVQVGADGGDAEAEVLRRQLVVDAQQHGRPVAHRKRGPGKDAVRAPDRPRRQIRVPGMHALPEAQLVELLRREAQQRLVVAAAAFAGCYIGFDAGRRVEGGERLQRRRNRQLDQEGTGGRARRRDDLLARARPAPAGEREQAAAAEQAELQHLAPGHPGRDDFAAQRLSSAQRPFPLLHVTSDWRRGCVLRRASSRALSSGACPYISRAALRIVVVTGSIRYCSGVCFEPSM